MSECEVAAVKVKRDKAFIYMGALNGDKQVIGKADITKNKTDKNFLWLHELEVHPLCRRKGVGTEMMNAIADLAEKEKVDLVYAVPGNPAEAEGKPVPERALNRFYRKQGYLPCEAPKDAVTVTDEGLVKRGMCLILHK
jgi:GNAT superfamily N-acetyltransferase